MKYDKAAIGKRVTEIRKEFGWTQIDLASYLCVTQPTVSNVENGVESVSDIVWKVASDMVRMADAGMLRATDLPSPHNETERDKS